MKARVLLPFFAVSIFASRPARKREVCTVNSLNDPLADDAPAITEAFERCGHSGRILLPVNHTFHIRSPVNLSPCQACDFQINGALSIVPDWDYWEKQTAVIKIPNTTAIIIHSDGNTGSIDANGFGWSGDEDLLGRIPKLFSISDESYQIHVRDLKIKNVPGTAFHINSNSSAVRFYGIDFLDAAATGYLVEQAKHVYIWNNTIRAARSCISILPNSSNIQVEDSTCVTTRTAAVPNGFELRGIVSDGFDWIRNIFFKNIKAIGNMNVVAFLAASGEGRPHPLEIKNATFTNISITGPAQRAIEIQEGKQTLFRMIDVTFRNFEGEEQRETDLECTGMEDKCDFSVEDWEVVVKG